MWYRSWGQVTGGAWGADGRLYATGHDDGVVFVLSLPTAGSVLGLQEVLSVTAEGQGIARDRWLAGGFQVLIEGDPVFPEVFRTVHGAVCRTDESLFHFLQLFPLLFL